MRGNDIALFLAAVFNFREIDGGCDGFRVSSPIVSSVRLLTPYDRGISVRLGDCEMRLTSSVPIVGSTILVRLSLMPYHEDMLTYLFSDSGNFPSTISNA